MSNTQGRSGRRKGGMNLAELLMMIQSGRWGVDCDIDLGTARGKKEFTPGEIKQVILRLVSEKALRGDELIEAIADKADRRPVPGPEVIYPTLSLLEDSGLIKSKESEKHGKRYKITKAGRAELEEKSGESGSSKRESVRPRRMENTAERRAVKNAMRLLAASLAQHMMAKGVDDELLAEVAKIIEDAAKRIREI